MERWGHGRRREGFALTDKGTDLTGALDQSNYCIWCHEQGKDSCSKGLKEKNATGRGAASFKKSPFGVTLAGCPLEEKISEFHKVKTEGVAIGALAIIAGADYQMGRAAQMGPGYVPRLLGYGLVVFGLLIAAKGLSPVEGLRVGLAMLPDSEAMPHHYVVCGAGETGMRIVEELQRTHRDFVVIDSDERAIEALQKLKDVAMIHGLADSEAVLESAGIRRASAAAVALATDRDNLVTTLSIRTLNPKIRIVVKEMEQGMANRFRLAGATAIVNPATIGGLRLVSEMIRPSVVSFLDQKIGRAHV